MHCLPAGVKPFLGLHATQKKAPAFARALRVMMILSFFSCYYFFCRCNNMWCGEPVFLQ